MKVRNPIIIGTALGLLALAMTGCKQADSSASSALPSQSAANQTEIASSEVTNDNAQDQIMETHVLTTPTKNQFDFNSYITQDGENIDPLRGDRGHFYFQTLYPLQSHGLSIGMTHGLYDLDCPTGEISAITEFAQSDPVRVLDYVNYQEHILQLNYQFDGENMRFIVLKDGSEIHSGVANDLTNLPKFTQKDNSLYFLASEFDENQSVVANVYRIDPELSITKIYSSSGYTSNLMNTFNYSGNYAIAEYDQGNKRIGILNDQDKFVFIEVGRQDYVFPLSTGFIHLAQTGNNIYSMSWIDKDTQIETDLGQTFEGQMGNFTPFRNNMFMYQDLNKQSYIGCYEKGHIRTEPILDITGFCRYAQVSANEELIYVDQVETDENGQTVSEKRIGFLVSQQ